MERIYLRGVGVFPFKSPDDLMEYMDKHKGILVAVNAEKILWATDETKAIINDNIGYCDGAGAVAAMKKKGVTGLNRIPGCELWLHIIEKYYKEKTFYLVGAEPDAHDKVIARLEKDFPGIKIVGHRDGYMKDESERNALLDDIAEKKPDVVFVAMGSPKQELLMRDMEKRHRAIYQGLGGSFDIYSGNKKRAPKWILKLNLEALYRLIIEPSRIKKHIYLTRYAWWLIANKF